MGKHVEYPPGGRYGWSLDIFHLHRHPKETKIIVAEVSILPTRGVWTLLNINNEVLIMQEKIIALVVVILITAILLPIALGQFASRDTSGWNSQWVSMWNILPVVGMVGVLIYFISTAIQKKKG